MNRNQNPMRPDNKNFILAIVLSMAIIFAWQFFYAAPQAERQAKIAEQQQQQTQTGQPAQPAGAVPGNPSSGAVETRDAAIAASARLPIDSSKLVGSINLTGAQFDDLKLKNYREAADPKSPIVTVLSPSGTPNAYFAEQGFIATSGSTTKLPDTKSVWNAPAGAVLSESSPVTLSWDNGEGLVFTRTISLQDDYVFNIRHAVENKSAAAVSMIPYARAQRQDTPHVSGFWVFFEGLLGVHDGALVEEHYSNLAEDGAKVVKESKGGWTAFTDKYWATALIPDQSQSITSTYQHFKIGARDAYQVDWLAKDALTVAPGGTGVFEDHIYSGAKVVETINKVGEDLKIDKFELMIDWGWFKFLTVPMYHLLEWAKGIMGSFGLAILLVTVLVKLAVFPLANKSYASMSKMKKLQPEMERIKAEFPDDRMKQQQAIMEMYKKEKVSPLAGCLPIFVQIPVFFALYKVILTTIDLRHAPFFGWIHDLSAPDPTSIFNLFGLIPFTPPHLLMVGVWPLLMGITMWVQMRLNPAPADPVQASMFNWMPVIFTFMLASMPAGLVIYWSWSNLLSILQQSYIMKRNGVDVNLFGNIRSSLPFMKKKPEAT
ncbi:MAG: membrane protein insertase YidC [Proteobacteria bacterium]|nr:membrane protein insertase YidC [Pseudomonadota bacterium]